MFFKKKEKTQAKSKTKVIYVADLLRKFDAASKTNRTNAWKPISTSGQTYLRQELQTLINRSRDLIDNNSYAKNAMRIIANNVVRDGILLKNNNQLFKRWANDIDLISTQLLAMKTIFASGSVIIRKLKKRRNRNSLIPIKLQILEPDYINTTKTGRSANNNKIVAGKEYDQNNDLVAIYLYKNHPADIYTKYETERVRASEVLHIFDIIRPDQVHAVPWLTNAMLRLHDYDDYQDAKLTQQKITACLAVLVRGVDNISLGLDNEDEVGAAAVKTDKITPGMIEYIGANDVSVVTPPNADDGDKYAKSVIREIAASIGITYEQLADDYSQVNFSSAKMARIEFISNVKQWQRMLITQMLNPIYNWFAEAGEVVGLESAMVVEWVAPAVPSVDEEKQAAALKEHVRDGFMTHSEAIQQLGKDPDTFYAEYAADLQRLDENKIILDSDARKTARAGTINNESI